MVNYSSKYTQNYATILEPLRVLTENNAHFTCTSSHQTAFDQLKRALTHFQSCIGQGRTTLQTSCHVIHHEKAFQDRQSWLLNTLVY